jgi:drug/metabolite transporter (DMT)-like permease
VLAIVSALAASACWGVADFFAGLQSRRLHVITVLLGVQAAGLVVVGVLVAAVRPELPGGGEALAGVGAGLAGAAALGFFYRGLAIGTMSVVAPISSTGVAVPVVIGVATGDRPGALQAAGIALAAIGVVLASREPVADDAPAANRLAVLLALAAAAGFGTYFVAADAAAEGGVLWALLIARASSVPLLAAAAAVTRAPLGAPAPDVAKLAVIGSLDLAATGLYALATTEGLLAVVSVLGALYPVATVLLARALLHERLTPPQNVGVAIALGGVALIAAG